MNKKARRNRKRLAGQCDYSHLERRELLAGDVQVSFLNGTLQITGDDLANQIKVDIGSNSFLRVTGSNTTINGSTSAFVLNEAAHRFEARLGLGNDGLILDGLTLAKEILVMGGAGHDTVRLRSVAARDIHIDLENGNDAIEIDGVHASKNVALRASNGANLIAIDGLHVAQDLYLIGQGDTAATFLTTARLQVGRNVFASFGPNSDRVILGGETEIEGHAEFWLGMGNDIFGGVPARTGNHLSINQSLQINAGGGDDQVYLDENFVVSTAGTFLSGGAGFDSLFEAHGQAQHDKFEFFGQRQPNQAFNAAMQRLEAYGIDYVKYGGVKLNVNPTSFGITVTDASPSISSQWDRVAQNAVRLTASGPTVGARAYGMVHTAMYDAWSAYDLTARSTLLEDQLQRPTAQNTDANKMKAMSYAAYRVLVDLFPTQQALFDQLMAELGYNAADQSLNTATAVGIGNRMAQVLLQFRHQDGSNQLGTDPNGTLGVRYSDTSNYQPVNQPGQMVNIQHWTPEHVPINNPNGPIQRYLTPHWGDVTPFGITSVEALRAPTPEPFLLVEGATVDYQAKTITLANGTVLPISKSLIGTVINPKFVQQFEELCTISANLTDQHKIIAEFWENGGTTSFPPGTWMTIGQFVSARDNHSLDQDAKLFFALGNSMMNASIVTWETKRFYDYTRPVRAIRAMGELGLIGEFDADLGG